MKKIWLLIDNRMGSAGQARGVGLKLENDFEIIEKQIDYNSFAKLPNFIKGASLLGVEKQSIEGISKDYPDMVISASRRTAPVARWIKKQSPNTKIVQMLHPGNSGIKDFDTVFVPHHDKGRRKHTDNIVYIFGAPHRLTDQKLIEATNKWQDSFKDLPRPLTAVLIGGGKGLTEDNANLLCEKLKKLKQQRGGSLLITTSARTPKEATEIFLKELKDIPSHQYIWGVTKDIENPFLGYMACSDNVVVTGDSVSMASEACGTGKPVYIFTGKNWLKEKHARFIFSLFEEGYSCALEDENAANFAPTKTLDTAGFVANKIKELF